MKTKWEFTFSLVYRCSLTCKEHGMSSRIYKGKISSCANFPSTEKYTYPVKSPLMNDKNAPQSYSNNNQRRLIKNHNSFNVFLHWVWFHLHTLLNPIITVRTSEWLHTIDCSLTYLRLNCWLNCIQQMYCWEMISLFLFLHLELVLTMISYHLPQTWLK